MTRIYWAVIFLLSLSAVLYAGEVSGVAVNNGDDKHKASDTRDEASVKSRPILLEKKLKRYQLLFYKRFERLLDNSAEFKKAVKNEFSAFPEGDIFPYLFSAFAYTNLALRYPKKKEHFRKRVAELIELSLSAVVAKVKPPGGKLENLVDYRRHATYLGQFNVALGCFRLIGGDGRFSAMHKRISEVLRKALADCKYSYINSYPTYSWTFDTIPCLVSLRLFDLYYGVDDSKIVIEKHLEWIATNGLDVKTGLPFARVSRKNGRGTMHPRGCDLSIRLCLMPQLDIKSSRKLYEKYKAEFWSEVGMLKGFREWPKGVKRGADIDSGPIVSGIGLSASGFGLAAAYANKDYTAVGILCGELMALDTIKSFACKFADGQLMNEMRTSKDKDSVTGFLMGDACMFYSVSWTAWKKPSKEEANGFGAQVKSKNGE